eukprot:TRINITY_DN2845_c0_g1_i3.p1 TRINITY_DN2845_c0_g1~~TRINITY_DN2845_c0_g1_i3.p1  ORF type:complete len:199 (-),score=41.92 TRINITY_DN2845_c0_g1_i3:123-719(-)
MFAVKAFRRAPPALSLRHTNFIVQPRLINRKFSTPWEDDKEMLENLQKLKVGPDRLEDAPLPREWQIFKTPKEMLQELDEYERNHPEEPELPPQIHYGKKHPKGQKQLDVPAPRDGLNVKHFLARIGKNCGEHIDKFASWEELFTAKSPILKRDKRIPTKQRKWILNWVNKYRNGINPPYLQIPPWKMDAWIKEKFGK